MLFLVFALGGASLAAEQPLYLFEGDVTNPPRGWVEFCARYHPECVTEPSVPRGDVVLTDKGWNELALVNGLVNRAIMSVTDLEHWGVIERWDYPDDREGDCEEYVLLKRRALMRAGWPRGALLITVVQEKNGEGHAILTVKTDRGEFVLDNKNDEIVPWYRTDYYFVKRQSQSDPNEWVSLYQQATSAIGR